LNLQQFAEVMSKPTYNMMARRTTLGYEPVTYNKSLFVQNFGVRYFKWAGFPLVPHLKQEDCSKVTVINSYGRELEYQVVSHGECMLELQLQEGNYEDEAMQYEPRFRRLKFELTPPNGMIVEQSTQMLNILCDPTHTYTFSKRTLYEWQVP